MTKQKERLLEENVKRRMMKLAKLDHLSDKFIKESYEVQEEEISEALEDDDFQGDMPPDPAGVLSEPEAPTEEPDGDEAPTEATVQSLVKAIADAITAQTGVAVDVQGSEGSEEGEEMEPEMEPEMGGEEEELQETGSKRDGAISPQKPDRASNNPHVTPGMAEGKQLNEEFAEAPKKTMPNNPGKVKDPEKGSVRLKGAEKPTRVEGAQADHKMKALEERITKAVFAKLMETLKQKKK